MSGPITASSTGITPAVLAENTGGGLGILITSTGNGMWATTSRSAATAIVATNSAANGKAGEFQGDVTITGNLLGDVTVTGTLTAQGDVKVNGTLTAKVDVVLGSDCAED